MIRPRRRVEQRGFQRAVDLYEMVRLDFADAYLAEMAEASDAPSVVSFDRDFDKVSTIERMQP